MSYYIDPDSTEEMNRKGYLTADQMEAMIAGILITMRGREPFPLFNYVDWVEVGFSRAIAEDWLDRYQKDQKDQKDREESERMLKEEAEERALLARLKEKYE